MSKATLKALEDAIQAHIRDSTETEEDPEDRNPGFLTSWVLFTEHQTGQYTEDGKAYWRTRYLLPDCSPASAVGVARLGLAELEVDLS